MPKGRSDSEFLRTVERAQADWIRQYMEQQEEVFIQFYLMLLVRMGGTIGSVVLNYCTVSDFSFL